MTEFLNDPVEIHSFWYGLSDAISWAREPGCHQECLDESHYYRFGYLAGGILEATFWLFLGGLIREVMFYV